MRRSLYAVLPLAVAALALPLAPALAEGRDPAYAAARAAGQVGEKIDGYLGVVGASTPALAHMVADLNIKRKAVYADRAQVQHSTLEEYAFTSGCHLILQTEPGEKYQAPDGTWHTRTDAPPLRHSRCP
ncbi:MAG: YdbL family protein [Proteobacteria bacterium]|nr:YdbL family protein [Pseudomonadota bacterium]